LPQLVELHGMAEVQIGPRRIETFLDAQGLPALEFFDELRFDDQLIGAAPEDGQLVFDVGGGHGKAAWRFCYNPPVAKRARTNAS